MNPYLARLKALQSQTRHLGEPRELREAASRSSRSDQGEQIQGVEVVHTAVGRDLTPLEMALRLFDAMPTNPPGSVAAALLRDDGNGWAMIESRTLGERVAFVAHDNVTLPAAWASLVRYTSAERTALVVEQAPTPDGLRNLHAIKKALGDAAILPDGESLQ